MSALILSLMLIGCGPKDAPVEAPAAVTEAAPASVEAAPDPEPEVYEAPPKATNADLTVTITHADGTTQSGHVTLIERSSDWYADDGWSTEEGDLKISADGGSTYKKLTWSEVSSITIKPGSIRKDIDCYYDSNFSPWMYDCTLATTATLIDTTGKRWTVDNRHKWRLTFDDDSEVEFWLKKHPAREQDGEIVDLDTVNPENYALYTKLQQRLKDEAKGELVVAIKVR